jgi:hypothetical protein
LEGPLKSCGYAPYILHMIERIIARTFGYHKKLQPLKIKNDVKGPVEERRTSSSHPRAPSGSGQQGDKPASSLQKMLRFIFGMCKPQHIVDVKAHHERRAQKKDMKLIKEFHAHSNPQPLTLPLILREKKASRWRTLLRSCTPDTVGHRLGPISLDMTDSFQWQMSGEPSTPPLQAEEEGPPT